MVIVDASTNDDTKSLVGGANVPFCIQYLRNPDGRGNTPNSRNLGLTVVRGDVVAFIDDDAFPREGWSEQLISSYADSSVAGVGGRALNGLFGEDAINTADIGTFSSEMGRWLAISTPIRVSVSDIDHMIGLQYERTIQSAR